MAKANIAFVHASPLALGPLTAYYGRVEPEWTITNLLDDGILRYFRSGDHAGVEAALSSLVDRAVRMHGAQAVMITCSAARLDLMARLRERSPAPVVKIDSPMAEAAVAAAGKVGALITFAPTVEPTLSLLRETAEAAGREVEVIHRLVAGAHDALLAGDSAEHDRLMRHGAETLRAAGAEAIVLAQVSMAHLRGELEQLLGLPVYSSLETSHAALKKAVG